MHVHATISDAWRAGRWRKTGYGWVTSPVQDANHGAPVSQLTCVDRLVSGPGGSAVPQLAALPGGSIALRNAQHPGGPALVYTYAEIEAFIAGVKDGEFDDLID